MAEKVTRMLIKVDLQCGKCYRKIKQILCRFPQIRDQVYDEKANTVMITVVCCSPEKVKDKICCKGRDTILGIEIIPNKPKEPEKKKEHENPKQLEEQKVVVKPNENPAPPVNDAKPPVKPPPLPAKNDELVVKPPPLPAAGYPPVINIGICCCQPCRGGYGPCYRGCGRPPNEKPAPPPKAPELVPKPPQPAPPAKPAPSPQPVPQPKAPERLFPMPQLPAAGYPPVYNIGICCCQPRCGGNGPCYRGYGRPPPMCYDGCGRPAYDCHGENRGYQANCCDYFSEENASGCTIM